MLFLINYSNRRKGFTFIKERIIQKDRVKTLYPKSELENLIPFSKASDLEKKQLIRGFMDSEKIISFDQMNFDSPIFWTKLNNFFIKKGYNPFIE